MKTDVQPSLPLVSRHLAHSNKHTRSSTSRNTMCGLVCEPEACAEACVHAIASAAVASSAPRNMYISAAKGKCGQLSRRAGLVSVCMCVHGLGSCKHRIIFVNSGLLLSSLPHSGQPMMESKHKKKTDLCRLLVLLEGRALVLAICAKLPALVEKLVWMLNDLRRRLNLSTQRAKREEEEEEEDEDVEVGGRRS